MPVLGRAPGALLVAGWCAVALLAGTACTGADSAAPEASPPVVLPGAPGDDPSVVPSVDAEHLADSAPGDAEIGYVRMMIVHHEQAVRMTDLAETRAQEPRVRALAARIGGVQPAEIGAMRGWLGTHDVPETPDADAHSGHHGEHHAAAEQHDMPGMATPAQLADLETARGTDFDRLFLRLMTAHHEGAVRMATDVLATGVDEQVHEMAQDVLVTQSDEIGTMRRLAAEL
ncbi:DUF305 domain-containing protein [Saccharopolyspora sp. NPDC047091]|uniref:DUF305 domain-containing protein n=1 Tax=Saccharopolyspora sp. NPDC047091 TaxID=3155924 RepID=UPI003402E31F